MRIGKMLYLDTISRPCLLFLIYGGANIAKSNVRTYINHEIRAKEVLVIGPNGEQVGVKPIKEALVLAEYAGLDLVLLSPNANPPVCRILDYNKFKYEKEKKAKDAKKRQKANRQLLKEYRLSPVIDEGDILTKVKQVIKYLEKGDKIKLSIRFKGRQKAHPEQGREVLEDFYSRVEDLADIEKPINMEGWTMTMILIPKK